MCSIFQGLRIRNRATQHRFRQQLSVFRLECLISPASNSEAAFPHLRNYKTDREKIKFSCLMFGRATAKCTVNERQKEGHVQLGMLEQFSRRAFVKHLVDRCHGQLAHFGRACHMSPPVAVMLKTSFWLNGGSGSFAGSKASQAGLRATLVIRRRGIMHGWNWNRVLTDIQWNARCTQSSPS